MANLCFFFVIQCYLLLFPGYSAILLIYNLRFQNHFSVCFLSICQNTLYMYLRSICCGNRCSDKCSPSFKMQRIGYPQESMPVDPRTCIPTTVQTFILYTNSYQIFFSKSHIVCYIQLECSISINMIGYMAIIYPNVCIHINSIESDSNTSPFLSCIHIEMFSIPASSTHSKTSRNLGDSICSKRRICSRDIFNTPIVREVHLTPL